MLELHYDQAGNYLKNVHVTRDGTRVGTELSYFNTSFIWNIRPSDDEAADAMLMVAGDFILVVSCSTPLEARSRTIHLCLFEEEQENLGWSVSSKIWPNKFIYGFGNRSRFNTEDAGYSEVIEMVSNLQVCNGAIYLPWNPSIDKYHKEPFVDTMSKGRWLFPHPDGSRAAYEHMRKTTFEDDFERLMPYFEEHPELMETFADLI